MDGAIEFLEDFRLFVGRNTNAIISYSQFYQLVIPDNDYAVTNGRSGGKAVEKATCFPDGI